MTIEITVEEKTGIIDQHIKNLNYNKYNLSLTVLELQSVSTPDQASLDETLLQISDINAKISVLEEEKANLE
jgi:hypothetical protein